MSNVTCDLTISIDGFVAGPRQDLEQPVGEGGRRLHDWVFHPQGRDQEVMDAWQTAPGAYVMGRNMFGPGRGEWDLDWTGWWGDEPPYGTSVFVLTHYRRSPLAVGATAFHFVTDGIESALSQAREAAGRKPVSIAGGASTVNQYLAAGLVDELHTHVVPLVLGGGERLFDGVPRRPLGLGEVIASPGVTHIRYDLR